MTMPGQQPIDLAPLDLAPLDLVVVGAGVAGLALADAAERAGRNVQVLEARERVGGRLLSTSVGSAGLDLGATWYWPNEPRVIALVERLGLRVHNQHLAGDALFHQPGTAQRIDGNPLDVACGRFTDGADALTTALAAELRPDTVQLGSPVHRIVAEAPSTLRVEHSGGTVSARHVALAVPPALAVARIEFEPTLPAKVRQLAEMTPVWMGAIAKFVAVYPDAFWRRNGLAGAAISHIGPMREIHDMSGPDGSPAALFGFVPGQIGRTTPGIDACIGQLIELFGPEAATPIETTLHDWRAEPWTSPADVERLTAHQLFAHPDFQQPAADGRLHWCSTETGHHAPGHIEGALAAAERAATAIVGDLKGSNP